MVAGDAGLLLLDAVAAGGLHIDHAKDIHHKLARHAGVVAAGVPDQGQRAKQPDSIDANTASQPQVQLLLNGSNTHKGHAQAVLHSPFDSLDRVELLQYISTLSCTLQNMTHKLVCLILCATHDNLQEEARICPLPVQLCCYRVSGNIGLNRHLA